MHTSDVFYMLTASIMHNQEIASLGPDVGAEMDPGGGPGVKAMFDAGVEAGVRPGSGQGWGQAG